ncbi:MAG: type II toxin-antitoxin system HicA family toxin [Oscillospiraceae bacterium]|nr:type II toxin-antitoxin system HicA family toxin [Oscillospiraceae bacterium]
MSKPLSQKDKLLERLLSRPKDFTFNEAANLLGSFGYAQIKGSKTGGSRVAFANSSNDYIRIHKPHPRKTLLPYQVVNLINDLTERGLV